MSFWSDGFWSDGFWSEGFWGTAGDVVVEQPVTGRGNWRLGSKKSARNDDEVVVGKIHASSFELPTVSEELPLVLEENSDDKILVALARILH